MNPAELELAVVVSQRLLGAGLLVQSAELLATRGIYSAAGALAGRDVRLGLGLRLAGAVWLLLAPVAVASPVAAPGHGLLLANSLWLIVRSRGPVCGGSDSMFFQVQLGLLVANLGFLGPAAAPLGLGWIAAQSVLSYFLAAVSKARNRSWWNGQALRNLFASAGPYALIPAVRPWATNEFRCRWLGWSVVLIQLAAPAVLVLPPAGRWVLVALLGAFHLANAFVIGLNRFVWAWFATYPALLVVGR